MHRRVDAHALSAKIFPGDRATGLAHEARDLFGDVPLVDRVARGHDRVRAPLALMRPLDRQESTEERAEFALDEDLSHPRRPPVRQEHRRARRPRPQTMVGATPPKSVRWRSRTFSAMPAATPASIALPPRSNMRVPANVAR